MGVRRWLTAEYDMTGLSRRLYTSMKVYWITVIFWALLPLIMIGLMHSVAKGWIESTWGVEIAIITESVQLNNFAPVEFIEIVAHAFFIYLVIVLGLGIFNMLRNYQRDPFIKKAKMVDYIAEFTARFWEIISIKKWSECESGQRLRK